MSASQSGGHVAVPLRAGLASVVTYTDGTTNIGAWQDGPTRKPAVSVLQNQRLLVDRGKAAANVSRCVVACWGATIQGLLRSRARASASTPTGSCVWAAGEHLSPAGLASALVAAGAVRAVELDINPDWVAGYLYTHHPTGPVAEPVVPGQLGIAGQLLAPDTRDFFAVVALTDRCDARRPGAPPAIAGADARGARRGGAAHARPGSRRASTRPAAARSTSAATRPASRPRARPAARSRRRRDRAGCRAGAARAAPARAPSTRREVRQACGPGATGSGRRS